MIQRENAVHQFVIAEKIARYAVQSLSLLDQLHQEFLRMQSNEKKVAIADLKAYEEHWEGITDSVRANAVSSADDMIELIRRLTNEPPMEFRGNVWA